MQLVSSDEKRIYSAELQTGHDIKCQIGLGLSLRVLDTPRYTSGITFWYPENCDIRQPASTGDAGYNSCHCSSEPCMKALAHAASTSLLGELRRQPTYWLQKRYNKPKTFFGTTTYSGKFCIMNPFPQQNTRQNVVLVYLLRQPRGGYRTTVKPA